MVIDSPYFNQARLLIQTLPYEMEEKCFALKGGTAINLFFRNMPRLSVDIDLTYLPIETRDVSLANSEAALKRIANNIRKGLSGSNVYEAKQIDPPMVNKLFVRLQDAQIKIEPNFVTRGSVFPNEEHVLCSKAQTLFEMFVKVRTVSFGDVYGGKICAALDRQHPRDLYDIKYLLESEGITEHIRKGFIIHLLSHDRPMHELFNPIMKDSQEVFENEFKGMAYEPVSYEELVSTHSRLVNILRKELTSDEKEFLLSVKEGKPVWKLLGVNGVENLPAVQWKQVNLDRMDGEKRKRFLEKLRTVLYS